ncbi:hypothetical protein PhCBS80983_g04674 [Powellomyces hirtus]|uniref:Dynein light intermediate chain n=1 Tax=Powellomyces hirtus TaxID=109895 RepID=A0A507DZ92_9FUNG|nr:hypothetical protein PhCBS80983_g04674 [Powellomyces hirtus]
MALPGISVDEPAARKRAGCIEALHDGVGIWDSILKSVASSKAIQTKNVLVVGDAQAGKSTIINAIRQQKVGDKPSEQDAINETELALSYSYMDVSDEENEDVLARAGFYHLASDTAFGNLFRFALDADNLGECIVLIVMDWTKPWDFLRTLEDWLRVLEREVLKQTAGHPGLLEEMQDRVEAYWRAYHSPTDTTDGSSGFTNPATHAASTSKHSITLPLGRDATAILERDRGYKEEQFDFIQQSLRTICLQYGSALFYTSTHHPDTLDTLRSYVLDRMLTSSPSPSTIGSSTIPHTVQTKSPFALTKKVQVVERDTVFVPSGWDSWGKIKVLRQGFDCRAMAGQPKQADDADVDDESGTPRDMYESVVVPPSVQDSYMAEPVVAAENEQTFLERHLELLQTTAGSPGGGPGTPDSKVRSPSLASPVAALEDAAAKSQKLGKTKDSVGQSSREKMKSSSEFPLPASLISSNAVSRAAGAIGAGNGGSGPPASQNEVLANFFQSLLAKKSSLPTAGAPAGAAPVRNPSTGTEPRVSESSSPDRSKQPSREG